MIWNDGRVAVTTYVAITQPAPVGFLSLSQHPSCLVWSLPEWRVKLSGLTQIVVEDMAYDTKLEKLR